MSVPALVDPRAITRAAVEFDPAVEVEVRAWCERVLAVLAEHRAARAESNPSAERARIARFLRLSSEVAGILGLELGRVTESAGLTRAAALVAAEVRSADTERKLALRFLGTALEAMGEMGAYAARLTVGMSLDDVASLLHYQELTADALVAHLPAEMVPILRAQLDLLVAFECLDAPIEELTEWAQRALVGSRNVRAWLATGAPTSMRGEIARLRSAFAWVDWDDDDVAAEIAPWPRQTGRQGIGADGLRDARDPAASEADRAHRPHPSAD